MREVSIIILICPKLGLVGAVKQKNKLHSPNESLPWLTKIRTQK